MLKSTEKAHRLSVHGVLGHRELSHLPMVLAHSARSWPYTVPPAKKPGSADLWKSSPHQLERFDTTWPCLSPQGSTKPYEKVT